MNSNQISYIALWSKDLAQNRSIFANMLGIPITYEDENVVVFQTEGTPGTRMPSWTAPFSLVSK